MIVAARVLVSPIQHEKNSPVAACSVGVNTPSRLLRRSGRSLQPRKGKILERRYQCHRAIGISSPKFCRGKAKFWRGDTNGAMAEFNRVIELDPKYIDAYPNRAFLRQARGDLEGAIADYDKAIAANPTYVEAFSNRGLVKRIQGDLDSALADVTTS